MRQTTRRFKLAPTHALCYVIAHVRGSCMNLRSPSIWLVTIQFSALIYIAASGPLLARQPHGLILEFLGLAVGLWAALSMRLRQVRISPEVAPDATLVTSGPYRFVRHPMYLAVLTVTLALLLDFFSWPRAAAWLVLLVDIVAKMNYEEKLLAARFPGYESYRKTTRRIFPFVY